MGRFSQCLKFSMWPLPLTQMWIVELSLPRNSNDDDHIPNRGRQNFSKKLRQDLDQPKRHFRDFLIRDGGHGGAIDPNIRLRNMASSELRRSDPVHSKETIYKKLAEDLRSWEQPAPRGRRLAPSTAPRMGDNERG